MFVNHFYLIVQGTKIERSRWRVKRKMDSSCCEDEQRSRLQFKEEMSCHNSLFALVPRVHLEYNLHSKEIR